MTDVTSWLRRADQALAPLRRAQIVTSFRIVYADDGPTLAITVPMQTDVAALDYDAVRMEIVKKQIKAALPRSVPFCIVSNFVSRDRDRQQAHSG